MTLIPFNYQSNEVRVINRDGEIWFVAKDIAETLGYRNASDATRILEADEKDTHSVRTPGGAQQMNIVSEAGLYSLILRSKSDEARPFRRWVTHEVLPAIRQHGGYLTPEKVEEALLNPDVLIRLATELKNERAKRLELESNVVELRPKARFADSVSASKTSILIGELAKILKANGINTGQNRLFNWLRNNSYLIKRRGTDYNMPTQRSMELGLFEIKESTHTQPDGTIRVTKTPKVTGRGQVYFVNLFLDMGDDEVIA